MSSNSSGPGGGNGPPTTAGNHSATSDTRLASIKKTTNSSSSAKSDTSLTGIQNTPGSLSANSSTSLAGALNPLPLPGSSSVTSGTSLTGAHQTLLSSRSSSAPKDASLAGISRPRNTPSSCYAPKYTTGSLAGVFKTGFKVRSKPGFVPVNRNHLRGVPLHPALNTSNKFKEESRQSSTPDAVMTDAPIPSNTPWAPVGSATAATANAAGSIRGLNYPVPSAAEKQSRREKDESMKKGLTRPTIQRQANMTNQFPSSNSNNKGDPFLNTSLNNLTFRPRNTTPKLALPDATMVDPPTPTTTAWYHASNIRKNARGYNSRGRIQKQYNSRPSFKEVKAIEAKAKKAALTQEFHESISTRVESANEKDRPTGIWALNRWKGCLIVTKASEDSKGFCEWHINAEHFMKFDLHDENPAVTFMQGRGSNIEFNLHSSHFNALVDNDGGYVDIPRLDLSRVLLSAEGIKQIFTNFLHMSDMPEVHIEAILQFVEREKKDPNWKPTLVVFVVELHPKNQIPTSGSPLSKYLAEKRPRMAVIRNTSRVTESIDNYWHKRMNSALDNHEPDPEGGVKEEEVFGSEEGEIRSSEEDG